MIKLILRFQTYQIRNFLLGNTQINLVFRSLIRNFDLVEVTFARKYSNKFGFSLAYS